MFTETVEEAVADEDQLVKGDGKEEKAEEVVDEDNAEVVVCDWCGGTVDPEEFNHGHEMGCKNEPSGTTHVEVVGWD